MVPFRYWPAALLLLTLLIAGCSPQLDWREVRPDGSGTLLLMPCKPSHQQRTVRLAGQSVRLALSACSAGDQTWALAHADVGDPAQVAPALDELRAAAAANVGAATPQVLPLQVRGATPNPGSARLLLAGKLPDGTPVQEQVVVFVHGTRVFQATVLGPRLPAEAVETFFGSIQAGA